MVLFVGILVLSNPACAVSITESPDQISRGERLTLSIRDLKNDDTFSLLIEGRFAVPSGSLFLFATDNFQMPISLTKGELIAYTENTQETMLQVKKGNTTVGVGPVTGPDGIFSYSDKTDVGSGTYEKMRLTGTVLPGKTSILTRLQLSGSKSGPDNSEISFTVDGIDAGSIILTVLVNDKQALFKQVTLRPPGGTALTRTVTGPVTPVPASPGPTSTVTPLPTGPQTFTSADRLVFVSAMNIPYIGLLKVTAKGVPPDWLPIGGAYVLAPDTLSFSPPATISFTIPALPDPGTEYAYFIGRYENGQWNAVPSTATSTVIEATIDRAGTYALMAFIPESRIPAATGAPTAPATVSGATVPATGTPKIASIAQAVPNATTARAPLSVITVAGALAAGAELVIRSRKRK
jgi:hypothetical protein